ncbi:hypothetical protein H0H92_011699 [Tricholoma furcatifolium]|nr:hypothetical protein H0H92_011699 [Tricholoma furcatifolium]
MVAWLIDSLYQPNNTRWLSGSERQLAQARMAEDAGEADEDNAEDSPLQGLKMALRDPFVYLFILVTVCQSLGVTFQIFFPTIGTYVWKAKWGPDYHPSMIIALVAMFLGIVLLVDADSQEQEASG